MVQCDIFLVVYALLCANLVHRDQPRFALLLSALSCYCALPCHCSAYAMLCVAAPAPQLAAMFVTAGSRDEADKLAAGLIKSKLAACVNIMPQIESIYEWDGKIERSQEFLLMIKVSGYFMTCQSIDLVKSPSLKILSLFPVVFKAKNFLTLYSGFYCHLYAAYPILSLVCGYLLFSLL